MTWYVVTKDEPGHVKMVGEDADHATTDKHHAEQLRKTYGGRIVELVEAPVKIVVSEDMASWLSDAKEMRMPIEFLARCKVPDSDQEDMLRAYVNGWTVEKPKRYLVRVPHANRHYYYQKCDSGEVIPVWDMENEPPTQFTAAEIEHYGLDDCERVEVTDDER